MIFLVYVLWGIQFFAMALLDTKQLRGQIPNAILFVVSSVLTYIVLGWIWLFIPILLVPIFGAILGGVIQGTRAKKDISKVDE